MVQGHIMPHRLSVLPSVILVTFIGRGTLPINKIRPIFRIRRQVVFEALIWLKHHNTKYYGNIEINNDRIMALLEDDVPTEILAIVRQEHDTGIIDQESGGYVPDKDEGKYIVIL
jgi:hypothetical protein